MKTKWKMIILSTFLSIGLLTACNVDKRESLNQENDVNFRPVQYKRKTNVNESNNDYKNQEDRRFLQERIDDEM
ncbi:hypothetical protein [Neobacillus niacini]|uniref:hypothetical protein n=1 Tax=Neobacillus niacini TaxID=86668 RepID=UPI00398379BE